jgi:serine/threonine protein kinase
VEEDEGDMRDFSCGNQALDHGDYTPRSSLQPGEAPLVVRAIDDWTGQLMTCLKYSLSSTPHARSVMQEVRVLKKFRHQNIVEYKGTCIRDGYLHVLVEMCDGGSIASILSRFGALDEELALRYARQMLLGLSYLHRHCIVHRHVTCSTCLVTTTGHIKLADFGEWRPEAWCVCVCVQA